MLKRQTRALVAIALGGVLMATAPAAADTWNERTQLTFDEAVEIPGRTLPPGTYVFRLGDANTARHVLRVMSADENEVITTIQAIPMKRAQATNDIVLKFAPASGGEAPALKGFFYPGRLYGHEFIYPEEQARHIADRTKTLVLSTEGSTDDLKSGTLHMVDAAGVRIPRHDDHQ